MNDAVNSGDYDEAQEVADHEQAFDDTVHLTLTGIPDVTYMNAFDCIEDGIHKRVLDTDGTCLNCGFA